MNHQERALQIMLRDMTDSELNAHNETVKQNLVALPFGSDAYTVVLAEWNAVRSEIKMRLLKPRPERKEVLKSLMAECGNDDPAFYSLKREYDDICAKESTSLNLSNE